MPYMCMGDGSRVTATSRLIPQAPSAASVTARRTRSARVRRWSDGASRGRAASVYTSTGASGSTRMIGRNAKMAVGQKRRRRLLLRRLIPCGSSPTIGRRRSAWHAGRTSWYGRHRSPTRCGLPRPRHRPQESKAIATRPQGTKDAEPSALGVHEQAALGASCALRAGSINRAHAAPSHS